MKHFYLLFLLTTFFSFAQIPANYYDSADGLTGFMLKTELKNIITNGHSDQGYSGLWTAYATTDRDTYYENDNTILDIYSENPTGSDPYNFTYSTDQCGNYTNEGDCYNREHLIPQSTFGSAAPMVSDVHHIYPTDGKVNGYRSNFPHGTVGSATYTSSNGSKLGNSDVTGYSGTVFEPLDEFKGDVARAILYFVTRYEDNIDSYPYDMFLTNDNNQALQTWALDMLLDWHYNIDPVDQRDIDRNNEAYNFQGNANPFISHPEYANLIWNPNPDTQAPTAPTNLVASNPTSSSVDLSWTASTDDVGVVSYDVYIDGVFSTNTGNSSTSYTATGLSSETNYCFTVYAKDAAGNTSTVSNQVCETTTASSGGGGSSEIFFSEYIEGGSNNKALEIANFTGVTVDLSTYTLKLSANGAAGWTTATYSFPGGATIADGDVYVIGNGNLAICTTEADDSNSSITAFNGNDAIGLFKNDVLIDILGTLGDGTTYAANTTLVRNPDITSPNTTYTPSEWTTFPQDTCDDLGSHTISTLSSESQTFNSINFYPNPLNGSILSINTNQHLSISIYNVLGKQVFSDVVNSSKNQINLSQLNSGIYLIKISDNKQSLTKKLIKQ